MTALLFPDWSTPQIFPAIDVRGGRCVRLVKGARNAEIHYDDDPVRVASRWEAEGARCLHVIDLGAAFGEAHSRGVILEIARKIRLPVQAGGGLRTEEAIDELLAGGVARVILGTRAFKDPEFLARVVARHGERRILVSMDCDGDRVKVAGWEETSPLSIEEGIALAERCGVRRLLVTATDRDGTLAGPRLDLLRKVLGGARARVVAAGGIGNGDHVRSVLDLGAPGLEGVVVGRALYEGTVSLKEVLKLTRTEGDHMTTSKGEALEKTIDQVKYDANGLVPAVVQDARDGQVLMVAYMNREALRRTLTEGVTCFWSRSRKEFWVKGATSGNTQRVVRVAQDCDRDCILVVVEQKGVACHTGKRSCFFSEIAQGSGEVREIDTDRPIHAG